MDVNNFFFSFFTVLRISENMFVSFPFEFTNNLIWSQLWMTLCIVHSLLVIQIGSRSSPLLCSQWGVRLAYWGAVPSASSLAAAHAVWDSLMKPGEGLSEVLKLDPDSRSTGFKNVTANLQLNK